MIFMFYRSQIATSFRRNDPLFENSIQHFSQITNCDGQLGSVFASGLVQAFGNRSLDCGVAAEGAEHGDGSSPGLISQ